MMFAWRWNIALPDPLLNAPLASWHSMAIPGGARITRSICRAPASSSVDRHRAQSRRSGSMRLREGLRSNRRCDVSVLARIMEDYAFLCIYASRRNALNSACAGAVAWHLLARPW